MALNPFTSFRKYQKFWMTTVLLLSMITFVLCTGVGGDLSQRLLDIFGRREGTPLAKVNGRNIYSKEMNNLKEQRNMANEFMKKATEVAIKNLNVQIADPKMTDENRKKLLPILEKAKADLEQLSTRQRYFGSGVKLEELVDFQIWLHEADRLGITFQPEQVLDLMSEDLVGNFSKFDMNQLYAILRDLRLSNRNPSYALLVKALNDEYRARTAQTALELSDRGNLMRNNKLKFHMDSVPEVRIPLSPAMLWDSFKDNRSEFDVSLVPIVVEDFVDQIPTPTEAELKSLFIEHQKDRYDPSSPVPGFEIPTSTRVEYVMGDPTSAKFKQWSKAAILMEAIPSAWIPSSPLATLVRYVGGPLAQRALLENIYETIRTQRNLRDSYLTAAWNQSGVYQAMANKLASTYPEAAVSLIAGFAQPSNIFTAPLGYGAFGPVRHPKELALGLEAEVKERVPVYATLALAGSTGNLLQTLTILQNLDKEKYFPLDVVKQNITDYLERRQAETWVNSNMIALRRQLEDPANNAVGREANFNRLLKNQLPKLGLELASTKDFYNRFNIDKAPELQPLVKAFEKERTLVNFYEGRDLTPESALKEGDFYRLFFDGTEPFSAAGSTYKAKPWPPRVQPKKAVAGNASLTPADVNKPPAPIELFDKAEKPFLFWKVKDEVGKVPASIDVVKDRVEKAYKLLKARDNKALPKAKELADLLQKSEEGFGPVLQYDPLNIKRPVINLKRLANLYTKDIHQPTSLPKAFQAGSRDYGTFPLPKDTFSYPREDMAKEILSLQDLKKPIEIGDPKLDELNKTLFEKGKEKGRFVQILTNKPRSVYYVAGVTFKPGPSMDEFRSVLKYAIPSDSYTGGRYMDTFFEHAFNEAGKEYQKSLMDQIREQTNSAVLAGDEERKSFDANEML